MFGGFTEISASNQHLSPKTRLQRKVDLSNYEEADKPDQTKMEIIAAQEAREEAKKQEAGFIWTKASFLPLVLLYNTALHVFTSHLSASCGRRCLSPLWISGGCFCSTRVNLSPSLLPTSTLSSVNANGPKKLRT